MTASFLDELRAMGASIQAGATKTLDVPGSGGRFAVRYRPPTDRDALTPILGALAVSSALGEAEERQLLVDCCDEVLRRGEDGELGPADPDGGPLRFDAGDERWGPGVTTARDAVGKLFALDSQPLAAARHVGALIDWLQGNDAEIAARVEGKSESGESS